jgi:Glyoxalase-like domain
VTQDASPRMSHRLPAGDAIFLDHVGHFVRDPQAATAALVRAGFAPTPASVQVDGTGAPTGTGNITAMLERGYIEALFKTADTPLGRELDASLARHAGIHLVAFAVADAAASHRALAGRGFRMQELVEMQRPVDAGERPGTAAFTVARLEGGQMAEGRIQMLTHHTEDMVWQPRWLMHRNGALGLTSVVVAVADVAEAASRFARFTGRAARPAPNGQIITLDRGRLELVSADACAGLLTELELPSLPFIAAYGIAVASLEDAAAQLARGGIAGRRTNGVRAGHLVAPFPAELGHGAWLFEEVARPD